ncbi:MAG: hypothetical protein HC835_02960 [Oscillatoriales cyanobacterium RM2_1_1]|nr:hypothetical protein [Oscillatoriales cyanobacterium RM2_1_1]
MPESKRAFEPRLSWVLCITLLSWFVLVPFMNSIRIPIGQNSTGVISLAYIENVSPYTDYFKYLILLLVPGLVAVLFLVLKPQWIEKSLKFLLGLINNQRIGSAIALILLITWLINVPLNQFKIDATLIDSFHQGEFLGFLPDFMQLKNPFEQTVLIHGWGLDVLPTWLGTQLPINQNGIAATRFFVNLQNVITCVGYFWVLWELTGTVNFDVNLNLNFNKFRLPIFLISCLAFCIFDGIFFKFDGRRGTIFILQLALTLRYFRIVILTQKSGKLLALLIGVSLPISFLYVYDRAIYFLAIYLFATTLSLFLKPNPNRSPAQNWLIGSALGTTLTTIFLIGLLGLDEIKAIFSQVAYWGQYGRYISFIPLPTFELTWTSQNFWLPMMIQSAVLVYLLLDFKGCEFKLRYFIQKHYFLLLLLFTSLIYMRITLDRSDLGHAYHGAIPVVFLVAYLIYQGYENHLKQRLIRFEPNPTQQLLAVALGMIILLSEPGFNLKNAVHWIGKFPIAVKHADAQLIKPDYLQAWIEMQPEISQQSCFFTLTSEGLWYYLFNRPSCSKYSYVLYAKPTVAQETVLTELAETQPDILLLTNEMWFQNPWDEILKSESAALIYQGVLENYRPYKAIQSHWFWKRYLNPLEFGQTNLLNGVIEFTPDYPVKRGEAVSLAGWAILPEQLKPADAVYLSNSQNQLLEVGRVNLNRADVALVLGNKNYEYSGWTLRVPTAILPRGTSGLKVWAYEAQSNQLIQLGDEISIEIVD